MIKKFVNTFIHLESEPMSPEERAFCKNWLNERDTGVGQISVSLGFVFHGTMLFADQFILIRPEMRSFFFQLHTFSIALGIVYWLIRLRSKSPLRSIVALGHFSTFLGYAYVLNWVSTIDPNIDIAHLKAWTAFVVLGIFLTLLSPFHSLLALIYSAVLIPVAWAVWSKIPMASSMTGISVIAFFGAQLFQRFSVLRSLQDARKEFANRKKISAAEKEAYNQPLIVARNIQDSFAAPKEFSEPGIKINFFQKAKRNRRWRLDGYPI